MTDRSAAVDAALAAGIEHAGAPAPTAPTSDPECALPAAPPPQAAPGPPSLPSGPAAVGPPPAPGGSASLDIEHDRFWREVLFNLPSWLVSTIVHLSLVLVLALGTVVAVKHVEAPRSLVVDSDGDDDGLGTPELEELSGGAGEAGSAPPAEFEAAGPADALAATAVPVEAPWSPLVAGGVLPLLGEEAGADAMAAGIGDAFAARLNGQQRGELLRSGGGTPASEQAVVHALAWLAAHQYEDGHWSFQHHKHANCAAQCKNPGHTPADVAATSLALLPFLGTGETHRDGHYQAPIDRGLKYLVGAIKYDGALGSLWDPDGTMYGHGLAAIVLCEAYGMTHDAALREPAQSAIEFIISAQDKNGGGWRYYPQTPGDTSVVGWQVMALKSAQMATLRVPHDVFRRAGYFLDSVQGERGAVYGYQRPEGRRPATTSIGLLCRMYLGWDRGYRPLAQGVRILGTLGPSTDRTSMRNNMYYNYYATQVMHHWGGDEWQRWNEVMREYLISTQASAGHETGSWYFDGADHGSPAGGRLYCTALAAMTLEVYYRHMPLYQAQSISQ